MRCAPRQSQKTLSFARDETAGARTLLKPQGDTVAVSAATGLDRGAGPKKREKAKKPDRNIRQITRAAGGAHGMAVIARAKAQHNYTARNARELTFKVRHPPRRHSPHQHFAPPVINAWVVCDDDDDDVQAGDIINVTQKSLSGTWQGELNGKTGSFPANLCVEV